MSMRFCVYIVFFFYSTVFILKKIRGRKESRYTGTHFKKILHLKYSMPQTVPSPLAVKVTCKKHSSCSMLFELGLPKNGTVKFFFILFFKKSFSLFVADTSSPACCSGKPSTSRYTPDRLQGSDQLKRAFSA